MSQHILVSGLIRSGTTLLGRALAEHSNTFYLHEPFNIDSPWNAAVPMPINHFFLGEHNIEPYRNRVEKLLALTPVIPGRWLAAQKQERYELIKKTGDYWGNPQSMRVIWKDPMAVFSVEVLHREFDMTPLLIMRSPVDVLASIVRLQWHDRLFPVWYRKQPELQAQLQVLEDKYGLPVSPVNFATKHELHLAVLLARAVYLHLLHYREKGYQMVGYEALSRDPAQVTTLAQALSLELPQERKVKAKARTFDYSAAHQNHGTPISVDVIRETRSKSGQDFEYADQVRLEFAEFASALGTNQDWQ